MIYERIIVALSFFEYSAEAYGRKVLLGVFIALTNFGDLGLAVSVFNPR